MSAAKLQTEGTAIQVFARIRPLAANEAASRRTFNVCKGSIDVELANHTSRSYIFDQTFMPDETQEMFYTQAIKPVVGEVLRGYNCTVFAYGQTGSGKTYTMVGPDVGFADKQQVGVIPRTFEDIWSKLDADSVLRVSYLEIYNEVLHDLLDESAKVLKIYEDPKNKGAVRVHGLKEVTIKSPDDFYEILRRGAEKRRMAETLMNLHSSRSHTVFTLTVHTSETSSDLQTTVVKTGKLNLVDLAGSENVGRSGAKKQRAREASSINQSLLTLGRVVKALVEHLAHVPFRQAKLTRILQDSLGGHTKTIMVATISLAMCNIDETLSTLDYASRARHIITMPEVNSQMTVAVIQKKYADAISKLQKDILANRTGDGVYLNEDNYRELLETRALLRNEAMLAIGECASYERQLADLEHMRTQLVEVFRVTQCELLVNQTLYDELLAFTRRLRRDRRISDELIDVFERNEHAYTEHKRELAQALDAHIGAHNHLSTKMLCFYKADGQNQRAVEMMLKAHRCFATHVAQRIGEMEAYALGAKAKQLYAMQAEYVRSHRGFIAKMESIVSSRSAQLHQYVLKKRCTYVARSLPHAPDVVAGLALIDEQHEHDFFAAVVEIERAHLDCISTLVADFAGVTQAQRKAVDVQRAVHQRHAGHVAAAIEGWMRDTATLLASGKQALRELIEASTQIGAPLDEIQAKLRVANERVQRLFDCLKSRFDEKLTAADSGERVLAGTRRTLKTIKAQLEGKTKEVVRNIHHVTDNTRTFLFCDTLAEAPSDLHAFMKVVQARASQVSFSAKKQHVHVQQQVEGGIAAMRDLELDEEVIYVRNEEDAADAANSLRQAEEHEEAEGMSEMVDVNSVELALVHDAEVELSEIQCVVRDFTAACSNPQRAGDTPQRLQKHVTYTMPRKIKSKLLQMDENAASLPVLDETVEQHDDDIELTDNVCS